MSKYIDPNTRLLCSDFIVKINEHNVYTRDLGSCGDIIEAIREYLNEFKKKD